MKMKNAVMLSIKLITRFVVALSLLLNAATILRAAEPHAPRSTSMHVFHVQSEWNLGGEGGWGFLCLDASTHQLYIPRTNHVMVVDTETGKVSGDVQGLINVRNIALDDAGRYGYITDVTDGSAGFVRVFDRSTLKVVTSIPTGLIPYSIVFDSATRSLFVFNSRSRSATVIDTATNQVIATIPLSGRPGAAVGDGKGGIFVTLPALGEITRVDTAASSSSSTRMQVMSSPSAMPRQTLATSTTTLFITCSFLPTPPGLSPSFTATHLQNIRSSKK